MKASIPNTNLPPITQDEDESLKNELQFYCQSNVGYQVLKLD